MIRRLDNQDIEIAKQIHSIFIAFYSIEAKLLEVSDFPPLKRELPAYTHTETGF
jgi:hypothetical protein